MEAGTVLAGRYRVVTPISSGAMGAVHRAVDTATERPVAVKHLVDVRHAARFTIESRLLAHLDHPRVVKVLDHFRDEDHGHFIVMELVDGSDLHDVLTERGAPGLPLLEVLDWVRQAAEALHYVHEQQVVHRDVKPHNLVLGRNGVVLVDFGIARTVAHDADAGTVGIGTPRYMAPEVAAGGAASPRSDVYGLAATAWTLLTGTPPVYADKTDLVATVEGATPELEQGLRAGLSFLPERRASTVAAFAAGIGLPLEAHAGHSLARSIGAAEGRRTLLQSVVRTAAGVFDAAAASVALVRGQELVYEAAWGAGGDDILGVRLAPGQGIAGGVLLTGVAEVVPHCASDPRFAAQVAEATGYVPNTMLVVPMRDAGGVRGVLSLLDRRDGGAYSPADAVKAELFSGLVLDAAAG